MQLVYFSPVPWDSFAQRPHKFVEWFHSNSKDSVLWIEPYPTRLPRVRDWKRLINKNSSLNYKAPQWLKIRRVFALPIEPISEFAWINHLFWQKIQGEIRKYCLQKSTLIAIGKPSRLAIEVIKKNSESLSIYDIMDNFPAFCTGISRSAIMKTEIDLATTVNKVFVSSSELEKRWKRVRSDIQLIRNGLDCSRMPEIQLEKAPSNHKTFGYIGTIGEWFDWEWIIKLATVRDKDKIRLIGPITMPINYNLPQNIELLPPLEHAQAMLAVSEFDVGLIPFKVTQLTNDVDPIKYYEYKAMGIPVLSTGFGEMNYRDNENGTFIVQNLKDIDLCSIKALNYRENNDSIKKFRQAYSWEARFNNMRLFN